MSTSVNSDQLLGLVLATGSPSVATDQVLALLVEKRLVPKIIFTRCDQLLALIVEQRGISASLIANPTDVLGNGNAQSTITATVVDINGAPLSGINLQLLQDKRSTISAPSGPSDSNGHVTWTVTDAHAESVTYSVTGVSADNTVTVQFQAPRVDGTIYSPRGPVVAGAQVYALLQPANLTIPPTPLMSIYADPEEQQPINQPILSDGLGNYAFYSDTQLFTLMIVNNGAITQVYVDQEAGKPNAVNHSLEWWVKANYGPSVPGAQIFIVSNDFPHAPMTLQNGPPSPLVQVFADSAGLVPLTQPLITDGFGFDNCYVSAGAYTVLVYFSGALQQVYPDQSVGGVYAEARARYDGWVRTAQGVALANARVIVSEQPCFFPGALVPQFPSNLASICKDANGLVPITQSLTYDANGNPIISSLTTDGNGHYFFYGTPNTLLTVAVYNAQNILQKALPDQVL